MRTAFILGVFLSAASARASDCVKIIWDGGHYANVAGVSLIKSDILLRDVLNRNKEKSKYVDRILQLTFEVKTSGGPSTEIESMVIRSAQANLDYGLNPSEFYIHAKQKPVEGAWSLGLAEGPTVQFIYEIHLSRISRDQVAENDNSLSPAVYHFNFDAGMLAGYNRWQLYRLEFTETGKIDWRFEKTYSLIQGAVVER